MFVIPKPQGIQIPQVGWYVIEINQSVRKNYFPKVFTLNLDCQLIKLDTESGFNYTLFIYCWLDPHFIPIPHSVLFLKLISQKLKIPEKKMQLIFKHSRHKYIKLFSNENDLNPLESKQQYLCR